MSRGGAASERPRRPLRSALLARAARLLAAIAAHLGWERNQAAGRRLGAIAWRISRRDRRRTLEHLAIAFPSLAPGERARLGRASFLHLGAMLGEGLYLLSRDEAEVGRRVALEGWEHVEAARAARRPILIVTGHCGNWELLAAALNTRGLGMSVIARALDEEALQEMLAGFRARFGTRTIVRGAASAPRELLRALRGGGALGLLIDQDTKVDGVFVPFFGRLAWTPTAAADLARRFDAAVLPAFIERLPDGGHRARIEPAFELPEDATAATAALTRRIEEQIRRRPEQWVWLHRRWRRRPPADQLLEDDQKLVSPVSNPSEKMHPSGAPRRRK